MCNSTKSSFFNVIVPFYYLTAIVNLSFAKCEQYKELAWEGLERHEAGERV